MQYIMLVLGDESRLNQSPDISISPAIQAYVEALRKAGVMVGGERLYPSRVGKRVSKRDGKMRVIDGPYADTREQVGGYFMFNVKDEAEALSWAEKCPAAEYSTLELRRVVENTPG